jgi:type II secretory ATPase GspE/PulE/Tfp pilus assembly ATPase PilB-like protein
MEAQLQRGRNLEDGPVDGESGRVGLFEFISVNDQLRDHIDRGATRQQLEQSLTEDAYFSFARYSRLLLHNAIVSPERIERALPRRTSLAVSP